MQSILLISDSDKLIELINIQCKYFITNKKNEKKLNLEKGDERFYITLMNNGIDEYEEDEVAFIKKIFPNKIFFYLLCYTSESGIKDLVNQLSFKEKIYIDDDQGNIMPFSEFKKII